MSGFYSLDDTIIDENGNQLKILNHAPNFVVSSLYELRRESKDDYQYPVYGWFWFDSEEEAKAFFDITD